MSRPKTDLRRVNFNLTPAQFERYDQAAKELGVSLTRYVQQSLFLRYQIDQGGFIVKDAAEDRRVEFIFETTV